MQRTFLDVWRHASRYDPAERFTGWLFTIARRRAIDSLRSRRHEVVDVDQARHLVGEDGRETADRYADAADVRAAVARLPEHERRVIELAYFAELTQAEIAARARCTPGDRQGASLPGDPPAGPADEPSAARRRSRSRR